MATAQQAMPLSFHGQPQLKQGISIEPYALVFEDRSRDTTRTVSEIIKQPFIPAAANRSAHFRKHRQMKYSPQVIWVQFKISNTHPTDTLHLWYASGAHAVTSLFVEKNGSFEYIGKNGICAPGFGIQEGKFATPILVPPYSTQHYFSRVTDYIIVMGHAIGVIHTELTLQKAIVTEHARIKWMGIIMFMIMGSLLLMFLYSLFQWLLNKGKAFLFYALYTAVAFCWLIIFVNPRFDLGIMPASMPWLNHPLSLSLSPLLSILHAYFLAELLFIPKEQPLTWKLARLLIIVLSFLQIISIVLAYKGVFVRTASLYYLLDSAPGLLMGLLMIIATLRSKSKLKVYLLVGEIMLYFYVIAITPIQGFVNFTHLPPSVQIIINNPPFFIALGLFSELFCFLLALARRNKLIEEEKNRLQQNYTIQLENELSKRTQEIQEQSMRLEQQHADQLKLSFEQKLAEMEMTALRAQMNPHFIFNCLNSIKLYTTENDAEKASEYLTKFSRLIRLVLENSRLEKVSLKNEIEALELYLEMEAMRFKNKLQFTIDVDPQLDTELVELPPMLLQPYVENAIWHGLMHKKEGGLVQIRVLQTGQNDLQVVITDNGVGRAKAAELKSKSATAGKSFGMKVTHERITLINQLHQTDTKVQVNDLADNEGNATGTEVVLDILI